MRHPEQAIRGPSGHASQPPDRSHRYSLPILRILLFCLTTPRAVGEIAENLDLSQTLVSHHLRLLRGARLVRGERHSRQVFYQIDDEHVGHMLMDMANHVAEDASGS